MYRRVILIFRLFFFFVRMCNNVTCGAHSTEQTYWSTQVNLMCAKRSRSWEKNELGMHQYDSLFLTAENHAQFFWDDQVERQQLIQSGIEWAVVSPFEYHKNSCSWITFQTADNYLASTQWYVIPDWLPNHMILCFLKHYNI